MYNICIFTFNSILYILYIQIHRQYTYNGVRVYYMYKIIVTYFKRRKKIKSYSNFTMNGAKSKG